MEQWAQSKARFNFVVREVDSRSTDGEAGGCEKVLEQVNAQLQKNGIILADMELNAYFCKRKIKIGETGYVKYRIYNIKERVA